MTGDDELTVRRWLAARDPGPARAALRDAVTSVPFAVPAARFPGLDLTLRSGFGLRPIARPLLVLALLLLAVAAVAGAVLLQPWRPFPPPGLLAFRIPSTTAGSSGLVVMAADGSARHQISSDAANVYDHSPRWSRDGSTLLFARTSDLDAQNSCSGVGSVVLYDVATATERVVATGLRPMNVIDWSPSERYAAYTYPPPGCGAQVELGVVDLVTGQVSTRVVLPQDSEVDPSQGIKWHVHWQGDEPFPEADAITTPSGSDFTTTQLVISHAGLLAAKVTSTSPARTPTIGILDSASGDLTDLGRGGSPAWSPDDQHLAFVEPGESAGPNLVNYVRDKLVIATPSTGARRVVADILWFDGIDPDQLPKLGWTSDGQVVYWLDAFGVHVVDMVTGRIADLTAIPEGCDEMQWQPIRAGG